MNARPTRPSRIDCVKIATRMASSTTKPIRQYGVLPIATDCSWSHVDSVGKSTLVAPKRIRARNCANILLVSHRGHVRSLGDIFKIAHCWTWALRPHVHYSLKVVIAAIPLVELFNT